MLKRTTKFILEFCGVMVAGMAVLVVLAGARLSFGPVGLDFLTPYIEDGLSAEDGSYKVAVQRTVLRWGGWDRTLDIQLAGVRITNAQGAEQLFVPDLAIGFSLRALMVGRIAPAEVELFRPRLTIVRRKDGTFALGALVAGTQGDGATTAARSQLDDQDTVNLLTRFARPPDHKGPTGYLRLISMVDADLAFDDQPDDILLRAPGSDLILSRDENGLGIDARVNINDGKRKAQLRIVGGYNPVQHSLDVETRLDGLVPADYAGLSPVVAKLAMLRLPVSGKVLSRVSLEEKKLTAVSADLNVAEGTLDVPDLFDTPLQVRSAALKAETAGGLGELVIEALTVDLDGPRVALSGKATRAGGRITFALEAGARDVKATDLKKYWPRDVAPGGREWVLENVTAGGVREAKANATISLRDNDGIAFEDVKLEKLEGGFDYQGLTVHYLRPLPPVTGINGKATVTVSELDFMATSGRLDSLKVGDGRFRLYDLDTGIELMDLEVVAGGPISKVVEILNHPRLDLVKGLGIDPKTIKGTGATRLKMKFPLRKDLKFDHVEIAAASKLSDVTLPGAALGNDLTGGELTLQLDKRGMDVAGKANLGGVPAELKWTENFYSNALFVSRYNVKGVADEAARARFGLDFLEPYVSGPVGADLIITKHDKRRMTLTGALDVKGAGLRFEELGWRKLPGVAGFARLRLAIADDQAKAIESLSIRAGDMTASGTIDLGPGGKSISSFRFDELRFPMNDYAVAGQFRDDGGLVLDVKGERADIRHFLNQRDGGEEKKPLQVTVDLKQVRASPNAVISNVRGTLARDSVDWNVLDIIGTVGKGTPLMMSIAKNVKGEQKLRIQCLDAGSALAAFDITDKVVGGTLNIEGDYNLGAAHRPLNGHLAIRNFQMQRAPFLAKLLSALSLTGILDALSGNGISFDRADVPFVKDRQMLTLRDARAHGGAIGFTTEGTLDLDKDTLNLKGTLVPAYTLNSVFADIPILGSILVPEKGSGLFAATYSMRGPIENPEVSVNPLATLTPGFLRGLFNIFDSPDKPAADKPATPEKPAVSTPDGPVAPVTPMPQGQGDAPAAPTSPQPRR